MGVSCTLGVSSMSTNHADSLYGVEGHCLPLDMAPLGAWPSFACLGPPLHHSLLSNAPTVHSTQGLPPGMTIGTALLHQVGDDHSPAAPYLWWLRR